jgi:hypothetical protein
MSELAAVHYASMVDTAKKHGILPDDIPTILNGGLVPLLAPLTPLPVRNPDKKLVGGIRERYLGIVRGLGHVLIAATYPDEELALGEIELSVGTGRHATGVVPNMLRPYNMPTGTRMNLQTQAVDPREVSDTAIRDAFGSRIDPDEFDELVARSVFLLTSADVRPKTTRNQGYIAFVSAIRAVSRSAISGSGRRLSPYELAQNKDKWRPTL